MKNGFTLVELVIVIVIIGILSIVAVPIYSGYVEKAKLTEGKALIAAVKTAQDIYYAEHGGYYANSINGYDPVLQIDARGNKYFKTFDTHSSITYPGSWVSIAYDSEGDSIVLFWNIDLSAPITIQGHKLPVFWLRFDGTDIYQNS